MSTPILWAADATSTAWTSHDTRLIVVAILGIALIVVLVAWVKMHPFLALLIGSVVVAVGGGLPWVTGTTSVVSSFENGVGATLKEVGLLIALGAMLGKLLADSGGGDRVVDKLLSRTKASLLPWAVALVAMIIGLPMFFEIGLVLLLPVIVLIANRAHFKLMRIAIPALAGLSALHGLIPPHPGPLIAIQAVGAQLGTTLAFGLLVAIPSVAICGPLFSILATKWVPVDPPLVAGGVDLRGDEASADKRLAAAGTKHGPGAATPAGIRAQAGTRPPATSDSMSRPLDPEVRRQPSFGVTLATILFPVVLMLGKAIGDLLFASNKNNTFRVVFDFIGEPLIALTLGVLLASVTFGLAVGFSLISVTDRIGASLGPIAGVILIVGAGGGFKQVLIDAGVGNTVAKWATGAHISVLLLGYLIAVALRLATGSATVATTAAAGIVAPLAGGLSPSHVALLALAIGAGSLFLSHVNDAGFWLVKQSFGLSVSQTFKTWSVMETLLSVVAFAFIMLLSAIF